MGKYTELEIIQIALLQLGALKSLSVILGSSRYVELLLVPKVELTPKKKLMELSQVSSEATQWLIYKM